jgi:hypothetical protein
MPAGSECGCGPLNRAVQRASKPGRSGFTSIAPSWGEQPQDQLPHLPTVQLIQLVWTAAARAWC